MQAADVGMQGMFGRPALRIAGVQAGIKSDTKADGFELLDRQAVGHGGETTLLRTEEDKPVLRFKPASVGALKGEL